MKDPIDLLSHWTPSPPVGAALRIALIVVLAWVLVAVLQHGIRVVRERIAAQLSDGAAQRAATVGRVLRYAVAVVVSLVAAMLVMQELGIAVGPLLGAAGVAGVAIGFGAQSLVKDYFSGLVMLLEDQLRRGDIVQIAGVGGLVEDVTLRYVRLRDYDGHVHFVPNGTIGVLTNLTREHAQAVVDVGVAYREDVDQVVATMREVAAALHADADWSTRILAPLEVAGVERWADSAVVIRCRFKVQPLEQWNVRREYLRRLKQAFDARGIEIPYPHLTVYAGTDRAGAAPPLPLRIDRGPPPRA